METIAAPITVLVPRGAVWSYLDDGSDQGTAWRQPAFDDSAWASGAAELGYGDGDEVTEIFGGPDPKNRFITTYFRHTFNVDDPGDFTRFDLRTKRDDGAVVYLNGVEIQRTNLPDGRIDFSTLAEVVQVGATEKALYRVGIDPDLLIVGDNVLAVEVHQVGPTSSDVSFDLELTASPNTALVTRGPWLQQATPTSVVVRWQTDVPTDSRVRLGSAPGSLDEVFDEATVTSEHEVEINGLIPFSEHFYSVGSTVEELAGNDPDHRFRASPPPGSATPARIWVLGDSGTANQNSRAVRDAYAAFTGERDTDVWLMLGDNAYDNGTDLEYEVAVFDTYPSWLRTTALWPAFGNHDAGSADSETETGPYYDLFTLPTGGEAGGVPSATEAYFSFSWGNIHFVVINSHDIDRSPDGAMLTWLRSDLQASDADWLIASWHHPPYSRGSHDSDIEPRLVEMRAHALPILETYGVDLVLAGHSHSYERSVLIDGHYGTSDTLVPEMVIDSGDGDPDGDGAYIKPTLGHSPHEGAVYSVPGSSGRLSGGPLDHPVMIVGINELGSLIVDVDGDLLVGRFLTAAGEIADTFAIFKDGSGIFRDGFETGDATRWVGE